ncbi:hypothetical protein [Olleya sp. R77988]|uniref:hypothetical protein n=1 Tax=Olleya sp. R77988 TaxID=3093875 RepID=UPI0037C59586
MKKTLLLAIVLMQFSCGSESKKTTDTIIQDLNKKKQSMTKKASKKITKLNCEDYFKNADYSSICFSNSKTLDYTILSSTDLGCTFRFEKVENFDEYFDVNVTTYKTEKDCKAIYNIVLMEMSDDLETIDNLGDMAGIEKVDAVGSNISLYIKHGYSFIQIQANRVVGTRPTPCFYSKDEMVKFAKLFISEL